jgi:hypothetical protein
MLLAVGHAAIGLCLPVTEVEGFWHCHLTLSFSHPQKPSMFDVSRELGSSIALYSRKVLIQTKATEILPKWLRFIRGMVAHVARCICRMCCWSGSRMISTECD